MTDTKTFIFENIPLCFSKDIKTNNNILKGNMEAHRNHKRVGKCNNCSRRKGCPERLRN